MMIQIDDKIVSSEILTEYFCCDLIACLGQCCVQGQSGAPLAPSEAVFLKENIASITPYLKAEGVLAIGRLGTSVIDTDGEVVTPLIDGKECAYSLAVNGISTCAIEKAWLDNKIAFRKPISCHLYPIRAKVYDDFTAINYDRWDVCKPAISMGKHNKLPVYVFLKDAIIRQWGEAFHADLCRAALFAQNEMSKKQNNH